MKSMNFTFIRKHRPELEKLGALAEQQRIAAILEKADTICRKRQQAIELADQFLRAVFLEMFGVPVTNPKGWETKPVSDIAEVQGGLQASKKREGLPVLAPYLRVANVYRDKLNLSEIKTMPVTEKELERIALVKNDILVVEGHGNKSEIGRCAIWDGSINPVIHQNHLIRVRLTDREVHPQYLSDFLNSSGERAQLMKASNTTSGLNTISTRLVKETVVLIPDSGTQKRYSQVKDNVQKLLANGALHALESDNIFQALSQRAFAGEL